MNFFNWSGSEQNNNNYYNSQRAVNFFQLSAFSAMMFGRSDLEKGNKILLPGNVLNQLVHQNVSSPMIFCIQNTFLNKQTYVGVLEFVADEGTCVLPNWIFQNLNLEDGQGINVTLNKEIPSGRYVKIQPHQTAFIDLPNPKTILENKLRQFTCLSEGDTIPIESMGRVYLIDILSVKPVTNYKSICVIEADVEVDFAPPLDYVEKPIMKQVDQKQINEEKLQKVIQNNENKGFIGKGLRLNGREYNPIQDSSLMEEEVNQIEYNPRKHKLKNGLKRDIISSNFQGKAVSLNSKK